MWPVTSLLCLPLLAPTVEIHVAANGRDTWSGRLAAPNADRTDGPLASPAAAVTAARQLAAGTPRRIVLHTGRYYVEQAIVLGPDDSGLTVAAATGETPVLLGGRALSGWQPDGDRFLAVDLPPLDGQPWDFRLLQVNGGWRHRARYPKTGRLTHLTDFKVPWMSTTGGGWQRKPTDEELTTLRYRAGDLPADLDLRNAELTVYHMWDESLVGLASHDPATQTLRFRNKAGHPPGAFGQHDYVVQNTREGMTEPGRWYLDRSRQKLVYWPLPDEHPGAIDAVAPTTQVIIRLAGTKERFVRDVALVGLQFGVTSTPLKAGGFGAGAYEGAVTVTYAADCRLEALRISNVAGQGIKTWQTTGLRVSRCEIASAGACGLKFDGRDAVVSDNRVHHIGLAYPSAIALWAGGQGHLVEHNEVHHCPYTGIAAGGQDTRIEANLIHHAMEVLHDGAGIYITFCKRLVVRGNVIRDIVDTGGYGASAYYLDEQAEDCLVEGNLSYRVVRCSHNHMAKRNTVRHNVFVNDGDLLLTFPKSTEYAFEHNVLRAGGKIVFQNPAGVTKWTGNLLHSATGKVDGAPADQVGPAAVFADEAAGDYRLRPGSAGTDRGVTPLDVAGVGPRP